MVNPTKSQDKYQVLLQINNAIISELNLHKLFTRIAMVLEDTISFDFSAITLFNPSNNHLEMQPFGSTIGSHGIGPGVLLELNNSHAGWVFKKKKTLIANDLSRYKRFPFDELMYSEGIISYVVTPLISIDKVLGTLSLGSRIPNMFRNIDIEFLSLVAKQVALAIDNASCLKEIEDLKDQLEMENYYLQEEIKTQHNFEEIVGESAVLRDVFKQIELVANTDSTVLIRGETGTGKELVARAIHNLSDRKDRPLIKVNCPSIPEGLLESELFGHERGAFTTAYNRRIGKFELADSGTIFLDELGDLPLEAQAKLLRILQEKEFERVGGEQVIKVDVRIIAATNRNLKELVEKKFFRSDLYYRLNVFPITMPPLRERGDDIPLLASYFAQKYVKKLGKTIDSINERDLERLVGYSWPGNIRELENIIERSMILSDGKVLNIPGSLLLETNQISNFVEVQKMDEYMKDYILKVLKHTSWRINGDFGAAKILGMNPNTLRSRLDKLGIPRVPPPKNYDIS